MSSEEALLVLYADLREGKSAVGPLVLVFTMS